MRTYRLILVGFGNVGQGFAQILREQGALSQHIADHSDVLVEIIQKRLNNPAVDAIFPEHSVHFKGIVG
jgi:homoserine dehydrogenase